MNPIPTDEELRCASRNAFHYDPVYYPKFLSPSDGLIVATGNSTDTIIQIATIKTSISLRSKLIAN